MSGLHHHVSLIFLLMKIYLAPLQGLTDWVFRESFSEHIACFDKTFSPFVRMHKGSFYRPSQCNDILPENNRSQLLVPQFLGNDSADFLVFQEFCQKLGYQEVNINMGCPFPRVSGKGLGAGMLPKSEHVSSFLEAVFSKTTLKVSVKCRLGYETVQEFERLVPIFNQFPIQELIIHPRLGVQQYKGAPDVDSFLGFVSQLKCPVVYNGDLLTVDDVSRIELCAQGLESVMIGRGVLVNPFLLHEIKGEELSVEAKQEMLIRFQQAVIERCLKKYSHDGPILNRLVEYWSYHASYYNHGQKLLKQIKKADSLAQYESILRREMRLC